jgi:dTMP kinase
MTARFIVLEGIDGSGKSEQARRLASWLRAQGRRVVETREPTDGEWGRRYRAWARGETEASADEVLQYFIEDRKAHVAGLIEPALARGEDVVCDRYVASTLAYQAAHGLAREALAAVLGECGFPEPDAVLWLRMPVVRALERLGSRSVERYEKLGFLGRVDAEYEQLGLQPIDAEGTPDEVARRVREAVAPLL